MASISLPLGTTTLNVACTLYILVEDAIGYSITVNGISALGPATTDPQLFAITSAIPSDWEIVLVHPDDGPEDQVDMEWVYAQLCPDWRPTAPVLSIAPSGPLGNRLSWTASVAFDATMFPVTSYTLTRRRAPLGPADFIWTIPAADARVVIDEPAQTAGNQGPQIGRVYYYDVEANADGGDRLSNQVSAEISGPELALDGVRWRAAS